VPVRRSIDRISGSSMHVGSANMHVVQSDAHAGKMLISGSPRAETSRPVQLAILLAQPRFSASRGTSATSSAKSASADKSTPATIKAMRFIPPDVPALRR